MYAVQVQQRDVPGIDCAFLAMDTEEGVEVVWNEVRISEKKSSKVQLVSIDCFSVFILCIYLPPRVSIVSQHVIQCSLFFVIYLAGLLLLLLLTLTVY